VAAKPAKWKQVTCQRMLNNENITEGMPNILSAKLSSDLMTKHDDNKCYRMMSVRNTTLTI